ncbi:hypothetical protein P3X46_013205 [Hevea brasiliensis]|uniref:VOC domain-containing protein n=1 Tax=Hevea brasiliensis TaxID=3981 RepID=A0ABQ9M4W8_HEVBR|nr:hypothetical protein P3X46_013205 [Hevea brasiliensis]
MENKQEKREDGKEQVKKKSNEKNEEGKEYSHHPQQQQEPPLIALNHVSRLCRNVKESIDFYTKVLGMVLTERPLAFDFDGAWLFNYMVLGFTLSRPKRELDRH